MTYYKGYRIGATCGNEPLFFIQSLRNGQFTDLFFGLDSRQAAEQAIDNWIIAKQILG